MTHWLRFQCIQAGANPAAYLSAAPLPASDYPVDVQPTQPYRASVVKFLSMNERGDTGQVARKMSFQGKSVARFDVKMTHQNGNACGKQSRCDPTLNFRGYSNVTGWKKCCCYRRGVWNRPGHLSTFR